jgi:hypothetical protein
VTIRDPNVWKRRADALKVIEQCLAGAQGELAVIYTLTDSHRFNSYALISRLQNLVTFLAPVSAAVQVFIDSEPKGRT